MATTYEASVQFPYPAGFWQPHTEYEYQSYRCTSLADAMNWLANNPLTYYDEAQSFVDIRVDGKVKVCWEFSHGTQASLIIHVPQA